MYIVYVDNWLFDTVWDVGRYCLIALSTSRKFQANRFFASGVFLTHSFQTYTCNTGKTVAPRDAVRIYITVSTWSIRWDNHLSSVSGAHWYSKFVSLDIQACFWCWTVFVCGIVCCVTHATHAHICGRLHGTRSIHVDWSSSRLVAY